MCVGSPDEAHKATDIDMHEMHGNSDVVVEALTTSAPDMCIVLPTEHNRDEDEAAVDEEGDLRHVLDHMSGQRGQDGRPAHADQAQGKDQAHVGPQ